MLINYDFNYENEGTFSFQGQELDASKFSGYSLEFQPNSEGIKLNGEVLLYLMEKVGSLRTTIRRLNITNRNMEVLKRRHKYYIINKMFSKSLQWLLISLFAEIFIASSVLSFFGIKIFLRYGFTLDFFILSPSFLGIIFPIVFFSIFLIIKDNMNEKSLFTNLKNLIEFEPFKKLLDTEQKQKRYLMKNVLNHLEITSKLCECEDVSIKTENIEGENQFIKYKKIPLNDDKDLPIFEISLPASEETTVLKVEDLERIFCANYIIRAIFFKIKNNKEKIIEKKAELKRFFKNPPPNYRNGDIPEPRIIRDKLIKQNSNLEKRLKRLIPRYFKCLSTYFSEKGIKVSIKNAEKCLSERAYRKYLSKQNS